MKMSREFISGFVSAVHTLGQEGDQRSADWSEPYKYLKGVLDTFEPVGDGLIENLRHRGGLMTEAADEIEKLRAAAERWHRAACEASGFKGGLETLISKTAGEGWR